MPASNVSPPPVFAAGIVKAAWDGVPDPAGILEGSVTVVINDVTRPSAAGVLLEPVAERLRNARVLVATGTHRDVTSSEKDGLLGGLLSDAPWTCNGMGGGERVRLGRTSFGTEVLVHPWLLSSDRILVIGSVEPHYFAGYTGGRKSILPGCAAYSSTRENHFLACLEGSAPAVLDGNPVHCDMMEAARMLEGIVPAVHACCVVRGREGLSVSVGSLGSAFEACLPVANRYLCKEFDEEADILVLKPGSALETNLYQSMKAVYNFETAVRTGGTILLDSRCTEGLGAPHMESVLLRAMERDPIPEPDRDTYRLGEHSIARLARIRRRAVLALHSELDGHAVADLGFVPVPDPGSWIAKAGGRVVEVEDAGSRAPMMKKARK